MKTGNTMPSGPALARALTPQWSPVMKTGNTWPASPAGTPHDASMEPGHEDREYIPRWAR